MEGMNYNNPHCNSDGLGKRKWKYILFKQRGKSMSWESRDYMVRRRAVGRSEVCRVCIKESLFDRNNWKENTIIY